MTKHDSKTADELIVENAIKFKGATHFLIQNTKIVYFKLGSHFAPLHWCEHKKDWRSSVYFDFTNLRSLADITELVELRKKNAELEKVFANVLPVVAFLAREGVIQTDRGLKAEFDEWLVIRDLERMALGIQASIDFYIKNTSSAIQGHINYGILGKVKADNPDAIPIEILERDIKALRKQAKQLKGGEK